VGHTRGGAAIKSKTRQLVIFCKFKNAARLSDHDVELMRLMHEEFPRGHPQHIGYRRLGKIFQCSRKTAENICHYRKRIGM